MKFERLENIITIAKGKKPFLTIEPDSNSVRFLQIDDLRNDDNLKYTNEKRGVMATKDDILLAWDGANAGTIGYGKEGFIGSTIAVLRKKDPCKFSTVFIGKFLQSQFEYLRANSTGATIPHIDRGSLKNLKIPVLHPDEQIRIANILSKAEALIGQRKESLRLLDEFLKSTFLEMFGDYNKMKVARLDLLGDHISYLTSGSRGWAQYYSESGAKFLRIQNIGKGVIRTDNLIWVNPPNSAETERTRVKEGDLIISITADLGRTSVVPKNFGEAYINQHLALIRLKENVNPVYAAYFYYMPFGNREIQKKNRAAVKAGLNFNDIKEFPLFIPSMKLQIQFARIVERTEGLKAHCQTSLQELENLYSNLSQKAFKGELFKSKGTAKVASLPTLREKEDNYFMKRKGLAAYIINKSLNDPKFGNVKFEKLLHLSDYHLLKRNLGQRYYQQTAGPYDNSFTNSFFIEIDKSKWFKRERKGNQYYFTVGANHIKSTELFSHFSRIELQGIDKLISYFKGCDYEQPEIISTLYAVWNNRIIKGDVITDNILKEDFLNWGKQKKKYKDRLDAALAWMRKEGIVPDGWGDVISLPKSKLKK